MTTHSSLFDAGITGKRCTKCRNFVPWSGYGKRKERGGSHHSWCLRCRRNKKKERDDRLKQEDPEVWKAMLRDENLKKLYGITHESYEKLLEQQGGVCAICETSNPGGRSEHFHVDHNHATGAVRGLLCSACNMALGGFRDDPFVLRKAADYVE